MTLLILFARSTITAPIKDQPVDDNPVNVLETMKHALSATTSIKNDGTAFVRGPVTAVQ